MKEILPLLTSAQYMTTTSSSSITSSSKKPPADQIASVVAVGPNNQTTLYPADALVLAVGLNPLQRLLGTSPVLATEELRGVTNLDCSDVLAVRLWLDKKLKPATASNVVVGFDRGAGGTFFDLNALQVCADNPCDGVLGLFGHLHSCSCVLID